MDKVIQHLRSVLSRKETAGKPDGDPVNRYVQERDEAAFEALVRRHGPMVLGVCRRVLRNFHDAEDAFQATFLVFVRKAATLRTPANVGNWLYGVAYLTATHARAADAKRQAKEAEVPASAQTQEDTWADFRPILDQELERLAEKYRVLLVLCDLEGRTRKEVAGLLSLPEGTVASRLNQARTLLARRLAQRGLAFSTSSLAAALAAQKASACVLASLVGALNQAARAFAAGQAAGAVPEAVVALTQGVLKMMLVTKLKRMMIVLFALGLLTVSGVGLGYHAVGLEPTADKSGQSVKSKLPIKEGQPFEKEQQEPSAEIKRLKLLNEAAVKRIFELTEELKQAKSKPAALGENPMTIVPLSGMNQQDAESLIKVITNTIQPASWATRGGNGAIEYFPSSKSLVVSNYEEVLDKVVKTVQELNIMSMKEREMAWRVADSQQLKFYGVADLVGTDANALIKVITKTLEPNAWGSESGMGSIEYFPEGKSLVIRHLSQMHAKVRDFLAQLREVRAEQGNRKGEGEPACGRP